MGARRSKLCNSLGIECSYITGYELGNIDMHVYNLIRLQGHMYSGGGTGGEGWPPRSVHYFGGQHFDAQKNSLQFVALYVHAPGLVLELRKIMKIAFAAGALPQTPCINSLQLHGARHITAPSTMKSWLHQC